MKKIIFLSTPGVSQPVREASGYVGKSFAARREATKHWAVTRMRPQLGRDLGVYRASTVEGLAPSRPLGAGRVAGPSSEPKARPGSLSSSG